ncbi:hypothetical protein AARAC_006081 [Aspergillus arachidicola]|uniref:Uncharacterized protein n=1 Tax=Aspergillus arachidicola TaxID=656916 RepID=A0A2G7FK53_9EURO|nr:hypothetical protein AARAC_006081 [Aspergillus arachidicola]
MAVLFWSSTFWRTRFDINGERGFLLPIVREFTKPWRRREIDWRLLYHCTCKLSCSEYFQLEIWVWAELRWLRDTSLAIHSGKGRPLDFRGDALYHYHNTAYRDTHVESIELASSLSKIAISAVQEDAGDVYIIGMEFIFHDRPSAMLGYSIRGAKQATTQTCQSGWNAHTDWPYPGIRVTIDVNDFRGIACLDSPYGIRGVSIIQGSNVWQRDLQRQQRCQYCVGDDVYSYIIAPRHASSISLDEAKHVIALVDNCKILDLGVLGVTVRRVKEYARDEWHSIVDCFKAIGLVPAHLRLQ